MNFQCVVVFSVWNLCERVQNVKNNTKTRIFPPHTTIKGRKIPLITICTEINWPWCAILSTCGWSDKASHFPDENWNQLENNTQLWRQSGSTVIKRDTALITNQMRLVCGRTYAWQAESSCLLMRTMWADSHFDWSLKWFGN